MEAFVQAERLVDAEALVPVEFEYPLSTELARRIGSLRP
jgi:hypothetical protein